MSHPHGDARWSRLVFAVSASFSYPLSQLRSSHKQGQSGFPMSHVTVCCAASQGPSRWSQQTLQSSERDCTQHWSKRRALEMGQLRVILAVLWCIKKVKWSFDWLQVTSFCGRFQGSIYCVGYIRLEKQQLWNNSTFG